VTGNIMGLKYFCYFFFTPEFITKKQ